MFHLLQTHLSNVSWHTSHISLFISTSFNFYSCKRFSSAVVLKRECAMESAGERATAWVLGPRVLIQRLIMPVVGAFSHLTSAQAMLMLGFRDYSLSSSLAKLKKQMCGMIDNKGLHTDYAIF